MRKEVEETKEYVIDMVKYIVAQETPCPLSRFIEKFKRETGYEYVFDQYSAWRHIILDDWIVVAQRDALDLVHATTIYGDPVTVAISVDRIIIKRAEEVLLLPYWMIGKVWAVTNDDLWD
jgi:hypothetical protein